MNARTKRGVALACAVGAVMVLMSMPAASAAPVVEANETYGATTVCFALRQTCATVLLRGSYRTIPDRGSVVEFQCLISAQDIGVIAITIPRCDATGLGSGEVIKGFQNGNSAFATATAGGSTTSVRYDVYQVCMDAIAFWIDGEEPIPTTCSTTFLAPLSS